MYESAQKALDHCKVNMMMKETVFLCTVAFSLRYEWNEDIPTARVDGITMEINPVWFMTLSPAQQLGLILHEVSHVIYRHMERSIGLDQIKHNQAADHYINLQLLSQGFALPAGGLWDKQYKDMGVMEIYNLLPDSPNGGAWGNDVVYIGSKGEDEDKIKDKQVAITNIIVKAMDQSEMAGEDPGVIPGNVRRLIDKLLNPVLPWETLLQNYVNGHAKEDYSWKKANRRSTNDDIRLPTLWSEKLDHLAVAIDLSGSVTKQDLTKFISEINHIKEKIRPKLITVIGFDTKISDITELHEYDTIKDIVLTGGGGTNTKEVIEWGIQNNPTILIMLTDGHIPHNYPTDIGYALLWTIYDNPKFKSSIGEIIHFSKSS